MRRRRGLERTCDDIGRAGRRLGLGLLLVALLLPATAGTALADDRRHGGDEEGGERCGPPRANQRPVADAGPDRTVPAGALVTLDGSASTDADGDPLRYRWRLIARPHASRARLSDHRAVMPTFVADLDGTYVAELVVRDRWSWSERDRVTVVAGAGNVPPVADAGADQTVAVGETVTLDGGGSTDADGDPLSYAWAFLSLPAGSAAALSDPTAVNPSFAVDLPGDYLVGLVVDDGAAESAPDTVAVTTLNTAPVADAGPDQSTFVGEAVQLDGGGSSDVDGDPLSFAWALLSAPDGSSASLSDPAAVAPSLVVDLPGSYVVQLIVDDGALASAPDTVAVTTENRPPVADAGADQSVPLGGTAMLDGSGSSDPDGDLLGFAWSLTSVPAGSAAALSDPTAPGPTFVADLPGSYVAQLIVDDGLVAGAPDTVTVSTENSIPIAAAGPDQTVGAGATVQLDGGASVDPDGTPLFYFWSLTGRPAGSAAALSDAAAVDPTFVADLPGVYLAQLIVGDGVLVSAPDTLRITAEEPVVVTVTASDPEAAEAGPDPGSFTFARSGPTTGALTVFYNAAGSAAEGVDYEALAGSVTLPAGAASAEVTVTPIDDGAIEGTETVALLVAPGPGYTLGTPDNASLTIADDDVPVVTVTASDPDATEAGPTPGTITFARTGPPTAALILFVSQGGTAGLGDYASLGGPTFTVTIPAGQAAADVTIAPLADNLVEGAETVVLTLQPAATYIVGTPGAATVTIADDPPVITLTATDPDASEAGPDPGIFTFARGGGDPAAALTVHFSIGGTAANNSDYAFIGGSVTIPAGQAAAPFAITPLADNRVEGAETVVLTLDPSASYIVGAPAAATVTIADDPPVVSVEATDPDASEAGLDPGVFTFTRAGGNPAAALQVIVTPSGTATNGADYAGIGGANFVVTFPAGGTAATVTINPIQDALVEGPETVVLTIRPASTYVIGAPGSATVTIADDD